MQGTTLGIIGYGDIGQAAAVKAKAMGMKIVAQRRRPELSSGDGIADEVLGAGQVLQFVFCFSHTYALLPLLLSCMCFRR